MAIKLIALDLDGTTLDAKGRLSRENKKALKAAVKRGIHVVISTGRCLEALPDEVRDFEGIRYAVTSNGAHIFDLRTEETLYKNCIDAKAASVAADLLENYTYMMEVFVDGRAYMERAQWEGVEAGVMDATRAREYVLRTRHPIDNLLGFMRDNIDEIENVNIFFADDETKEKMREVLLTLKDVTITTSLKNNLEIGGADTGKGKALLALCDLLDVHKGEILACGDSPNDIDMLEVAGVPIAVGNAEESVKEKAVHVVAGNEADGVAEAIKKYALDAC